MFDDIKLSRPDLAIDSVHDNRHALDDVPFARESIPYIVVLPEEGIKAFIYTWVNKESEAGAALAIFGPGVGGEPIQQRLPDRKVPEDMDFSNWQIDSFSLRQDLEFKHADIRWETDNALLEFSYDAIHPPYAYGSHKDGCPAFVASNRIEQSGRVKGRIVINGREIPFDSYGHRDHSWGVRIWGAFQYYNWFQGQSADGAIAINYWKYLTAGREHLRGYVFKDGLLAEITRLDTDVTFTDDLLQETLVSVIQDEAGRETIVNAEFFAHYNLVPSDDLHLMEGGARATFDGKPGQGQLEVGWPPSYVDFVKQQGPF